MANGKLFAPVLALFMCIASSIAEDKFVNIVLQSNWGQTPLLLDISEYIASENNELFWKFVEELGVLDTKLTEQLQYQHVLKSVSGYLSEPQQDLMTFSATLRYFSPRVQLYKHVLNTVVSELSTELQEKVKKCAAWVFVNNQVVCSVSELTAILSSGDFTTSTAPLEVDHIFPSAAKEESPTIYLYASIGTQEFQDFHKLLREQATNGKINYVLRHLFHEKPEKMNLGGYGLELAIKSLEYKAEDDSKVQGGSVQNEANIAADEEAVQGFLFGTLLKRKPHLSAELSTFKSVLKASDEKFEDLKVWHLKDLGYQASSRIVSSSNPLRLMRDISQNFPTHAISLSRVKLNETFKASIQEATSSLVPPGQSAVLLNGRIVELDQADPFSLYSVLKEEAEKLDSITRLRVPKVDAFKILNLGAGSSESVQRFNIYGEEIQWINNLETDSMYANWASSFNGMFSRVWPGTFRQVAKNFFSVVFVTDATSGISIQVMNYLESFIQQMVPMRIGLIFATEDIGSIAKKAREDSFELAQTDSLKLVRAFLHLSKTSTPRNALSFLRTVGHMSMHSGLNENTMQQAFSNFFYGFNAVSTFKEVIQSGQYDDVIISMNKFVAQKGMTNLPIGFVNGVPVDATSPDMMAQGMINQYFMQTPYIQSLIRGNQLRPGTDLYKSILSEPDVLPRFNALVLGLGQALKFTSLTKQGKAQQALDSVSYFTNADDQDSVKAVTQLIELNPNSLHSLQIAYESLAQLDLEGSSLTRVGFIYNPTESDDISLLIPKAIMAAFPLHILSKSNKFAKELLELAVNTFDISQNKSNLNLENIRTLAGDLSMKAEKIVDSISSTQRDTILLDHRSFWASVPSSPEQTTILANGRVLTIPNGLPFPREDLQFLSSFEFKQRAHKVQNLVNTITFEGVEADQLTSNFLSDVIMKTVSVLGVDEQKGVKKITIPQGLKSSFSVGASEINATFSIVAVLNPLSVEAQKITPILEALVAFFDTRVDVLLNPSEISELPLKNFYTYVMPDKIEFDVDGSWIGPSGTFSHVPVNRLLTLNLDIPGSWLVTPVVAPYDLDNIRLEDISDRVLYAQFELVNIIVEGHCYEVNPNLRIMQAPPRGLELVLGTPKQPNVQDTIVMSNLGYFQLKANPGAWTLSLKQDSRSSDIFQIVQEFSGKVIDTQTVAVSDFTGKVISLKVQKRPGKESQQLLAEGDEVQDHTPNMWDSFSGLLGRRDGGTKPENDSETLHVFSLASGHLYERFLKIMMLSVIKHTKSPVKFWLLANFLSPKFKDFIPHMAKKYNFEYALVTYKWPSWLHKQTEKQRIIWGYKILFLDVLFPLDLKKVIYVDADQVVRADLKELYDMDLHGAPYAYTPFCEGEGVGNPETNGFRFWSQGFWQNHLHGNPYHISALYVVDLKQFRKLAAGDNLRATYSSLSQDPNSLANLDQDLPNYLQHMVKIHSLPTEWLWCETWCSQEIKAKAKTIDLCNNPLTKTPKLVNAVKIIPEWTDLDNEVKAIETEIKNNANVLNEAATQVL